MSTRLVPAIVLAMALPTAPTRAQSPPDGFDEVRNHFGLCKIKLRNLTTQVKERLDEARTWDREHRAAVAGAEAAFWDAKLKAEIAEVAILEYERGAFVQDLATADGDVALADAGLKQAEDRLDRARARLERVKALVAEVERMPRATIRDVLAAYTAGTERESAEIGIIVAQLGITKAQFEKERAGVRKDVIVKFTKEKTLRELRAASEKAKAESAIARARLIDLKATGEDRGLTDPERAALARIAGLEPAWKAILARRGEIARRDPATRDDLKRRLGDFAKALDEAWPAWNSAREARLDDRDLAILGRAGREIGAK